MLSLGIIDNDTAFIGALGTEAPAAGIRTVHLRPGPPLAHDLKSKRLTAALLSPDACGPNFWADLQRLCEEHPDLSVLVCSERTDLASRVRGLRLGADDWITKPAAASEVLARVEATQRARWSGYGEPELFARRCGELEFRPGEADVRVDEVPVGLTAREFELLSFLVDAEGGILEPRIIYRRIWGGLMSSETRSVYTYIFRLRTKLRRASPSWDYIHSHPRLGYRFDPQQKERSLRLVALARSSAMDDAAVLSPAA